MRIKYKEGLLLDTLGMILMLVTLVLFIMAIIGLIKRNGTAKKRFKWTGISFIAMFIVAAIAGANDQQTTTEEANSTVSGNSSSEEKVKAEADAKAKVEAEEKAKADAEAKKKEEEVKETAHAIGEPVKVGDFEYVITAANEDIIIQSNNQFIDSKETTGKFAIIDYSVKNLDKKARMVDSNLFIVKDEQGNEYEPMVDGDIMMLLGDSNLFLEEVNPGLSREGKIVFELPSEITNYSLEVSSGLGWSGGEYKTIKLK